MLPNEALPLYAISVCERCVEAEPLVLWIPGGACNQHMQSMNAAKAYPSFPRSRLCLECSKSRLCLVALVRTRESRRSLWCFGFQAEPVTSYPSFQAPPGMQRTRFCLIALVRSRESRRSLWCIGFQAEPVTSTPAHRSFQAPPGMQQIEVLPRSLSAKSGVEAEPLVHWIPGGACNQRPSL